MNIRMRNQDIVNRRLAGETFGSIGKIYGISRQQAHQTFKSSATEAEKDEADTVARRLAEDRAPKPEPRIIEDDPDFPKGENRIRVNVPNARNTDIPMSEVRAGIRRWLAGEFEIALDTRGARRFSPVMAESMHVLLSVRCTSQNIPIAAAIRGVIAYLERENEGHE